MPFNDFATRPRRRGRAIAAALVALFVTTTSLPAQFIVPRGEDASTIPSGFVRLRVLPTWSRAFDRWSVRDGDRRLVPIGSELTSDSLGVRQLPALDSAQRLMRALSQDEGFRINLGRSESAASIRTVGVPITLEYGVTSRLMLGVTVPIVQTRARFTYLLNNDRVPIPGIVRANTGSNAREPTQNQAIVGRLNQIAEELATNRTLCMSGSTAPFCAAILAQGAQVDLLIQQARDAASRVTALYGVSLENPGQLVVPIANSPVQLAIIASLNAIAARAAEFGVDVNLEAEQLGAARGPAGRRLLDSLVLPRFDSVAEVSRLGLGDIEVGAKLLVLDTQRADTARRRGIRLAVAGLVRFGTGAVALDSPFGLGTGDGQMDVEGAAFLDANVSARAGATVSARYTRQLGEGEAFLPTPSGELADILDPVLATVSLGDVLMLEALPRYRVTNALSIDGYYTLATTAGATYRRIFPPESSLPAEAPVTTEATTVQQLGIGVSYSTLDQWMRRGARLPVDLIVSYNTTVASSGGPALKTSQMQIQLRLYQQLFGHRPRRVAPAR